jgi:hypothetical protein
MTTSPTSVPEPTRLTRGAHLCAEDGACLMEAVSRYAGEPWTDAPACTHPLLAHLARLVNDASTDSGRQRLLPAVPTLAGAHTDDPASYPRLAVACTEAAFRHRSSLLLVHLESAARAELARQTAAASNRSTSAARRVWRRLYQQGPARRAVEIAVAATDHLQPHERDRVLWAMLSDAVATLMVEQFPAVSAAANR